MGVIDEIKGRIAEVEKDIVMTRKKIAGKYLMSVECESDGDGNLVRKDTGEIVKEYDGASQTEMSLEVNVPDITE